VIDFDAESKWDFGLQLMQKPICFKRLRNVSTKVEFSTEKNARC
jgi:hypothetical protein